MALTKLEASPAARAATRESVPARAHGAASRARHKCCVWRRRTPRARARVHRTTPPPPPPHLQRRRQ
eukprot:333796-Prymnesium_polylepis.1